jgi:hypothetical protein
VVHKVYKDKWLDLMEQLGLRDIEENEVRAFAVVIEPQEGEAVQIGVDGERKTIYLINANGNGYALRQIVAKGKGTITVSEIPLTHRRLGEVDVRFAYGEGKVGDRDALLVATDKGGEGQLTIRIRPQKEGAALGDQEEIDA